MDYRRPALVVTTLGAFLIPFVGSSVSVLSKKCEDSICNLYGPLCSWHLRVPFERPGEIRG